MYNSSNDVSVINKIITLIMIILNLGSNIGQRSDNLQRCIDKLAKKLIVMEKSKYIYSRPIAGSNINQDDYFINIGLKVYTSASPLCLLGYVKEIESSMGRAPTDVVWSSRIIDIDIILFNDVVINSKMLHLPHKEMLNRDFVLLPLLELAPRYQYKISSNNSNIGIEKLYRNLNNLSSNII